MAAYATSVAPSEFCWSNIIGTNRLHNRCRTISEANLL
jgi:hypothetical protein